MPWTRLDLAVVLTAALISATVISYRTWQHLTFGFAAKEILETITTVATTVEQYRKKSGDWFPPSEAGDRRVQVYPDPFNPNAKPYQGLDTELLSQENNAGLVIQLARFQHGVTTDFPVHLFHEPYLDGEPYLRVLLDYGKRGQVETEILIRVQDALPDHVFGEVDDHYYVIDLRRLMNVE